MGLYFPRKVNFHLTLWRNFIGSETQLPSLWVTFEVFVKLARMSQQYSRAETEPPDILLAVWLDSKKLLGSQPFIWFQAIGHPAIKLASSHLAGSQLKCLLLAF